jgi:hypothetical protein
MDCTLRQSQKQKNTHQMSWWVLVIGYDGQTRDRFSENHTTVAGAPIQGCSSHRSF